MTTPLAYIIEPQGGDPIKISRMYLTDIFEAQDGGETRFGSRENPRIKISYNAVVIDTDIHTFEILARSFRDRNLAVSVPYWQDVTRITSAVSSGGSSLPCDTVGREFIVNHWIGIWQNFMTVDIHQISAVNPSSVEIVGDTLNQNWPINTIVMPVFRGYLQSVELRRVTAYHSVYTVTLETESR